MNANSIAPFLERENNKFYHVMINSDCDTLRTIPRYYFEQDNSFKERELINFLCDGYYSWNSITNNPKRIIRIITSLPCIIHKAFGGEKCPYNFTSYYKNVVVPIKKITLS